MKVNLVRRLRFALSALSLACACGLEAARADAIEDFYKGKNITFIVGYDAGGGYDQYARTLGRFISSHISGGPNVVIQNMPGAGGLRAANFLYNLASHDGLTIGMLDQSLPLQQMLDPDNVKLDVAKFAWIGRLVSNASVLYAWHTAPVKTIKDAFDKELLVSTSGQNSRMMSSFLRNQLGLKFKDIKGYAGTNEARLAMQRGEVQAVSQPWSALRTESPELLRDHLINLLLQMGVQSHPDLKDIPLVVDLARTPDERSLLELMAGGSLIGRAITSPPDEPGDRVAALRAAFMTTMKDPAFRDECAKIGLDLDPLAGEELQAFIVKQEGISPALVAEARRIAAIEK